MSSFRSVVPREPHSNEARQDDQQVQRLELGKPVERELAGGQSHSYQLTIDAGQYLHLVVEQRGVDVVAQLSGPDGQLIMEFDDDGRRNGQESVSWVTEAEVSYRLTVQSKQKAPPVGVYDIRVEEWRAATANDRALHEARKLFQEHRKLKRAGKYDEALKLVERVLEIRESLLAPDHFDVAIAVNSLADLYLRNSDYAKAERL